MSNQEDILFEENNHWGVITLNRPTVLNALNHTMVAALYNKLNEWKAASHIQAVLIRAAEGRAFCAGGDLRTTYEHRLQHDIHLIDFFREEYHLNRCIFHFPKPYVALLDGITMGGGVGISIHGSHRVATENLLFAMPETGIGFFPDVGGTYFLPRLPGRTGFYLGLTGARLHADDCLKLGIAHEKVRHATLPDLVQALLHADLSTQPHEVITQVIHGFHAPREESSIHRHQFEIDTYFSKPTVEAILHGLASSPHAWCQEVLAVMQTKSPTSLKVTLHALQQGKELAFDACMQMEYRLAYRFLQAHDFAEGIRAVIIDKDQAPHWRPS